MKRIKAENVQEGDLIISYINKAMYKSKVCEVTHGALDGDIKIYSDNYCASSTYKKDEKLLIERITT